MSEQQEGASGEPQGSMGEHIFYKLKDALDRIPPSGPTTFLMSSKAYENIHKLRADALAEQVEKLRVRRDAWRERYEQARADLEEHKQGREVLAELLAYNPVAKELRREVYALRDYANEMRERRNGWRTFAMAQLAAIVVYVLARAVLA